MQNLFASSAGRIVLRRLACVPIKEVTEAVIVYDVPQRHTVNIEIYNLEQNASLLHFCKNIKYTTKWKQISVDRVLPVQRGDLILKWLITFEVPAIANKIWVTPVFEQFLH